MSAPSIRASDVSDEELLLLRHLHALRAAGTGSAHAVAVVEAGLQPGALRDAVHGVREALQRGADAPLAGPGASAPFAVQVAAQADAIDVASLGVIVDQLDAERRLSAESRVQVNAWIATAAFGVVVAGAAAALPALLLRDEMFMAPTGFMTLTRGAVLAVLTLIIGGAFFAALRARRGQRDVRFDAAPVADTARRLRLFAALVRGGVAEERASLQAFGRERWRDAVAAVAGAGSGGAGSGPVVTAWTEALLKRHGAADVAGIVADSLEGAPVVAERARADRRRAALIVSILVVTLLSLVAAYLPIFTVAGSIS